MSEEKVKKFEQPDEVEINSAEKEIANVEIQKKNGDAESIEGPLAPEEEKEIDKRKKKIEKQKQEIKEEKLPEEEKETVKKILAEAKKTGTSMTIPNTETVSTRLITAVIEGGQKLKSALRAVELANDPFLFDTFSGRLTEDETWQKLKESGEI